MAAAQILFNLGNPVLIALIDEAPAQRRQITKFVAHYPQKSIGIAAAPGRTRRGYRFQLHQFEQSSAGNLAAATRGKIVAARLSHAIAAWILLARNGSNQCGNRSIAKRGNLEFQVWSRVGAPRRGLQETRTPRGRCGGIGKCNAPFTIVPAGMEASC